MVLYNKQINTMPVLKKQDLLMNSLIEFFLNENDGKNLEQLLQILNGKTNISLRIIDWFVTNYAKKNNIYWIRNNTRFVVYLNYKSQLKSYSKKQFDPFCRRERLQFFYNETDNVLTTIGQLNFFKWAIKYNILNYIMENLNDIEDDMHNCLKYIYNKKNKSRKKRKELSISATKSLNKHDVEVVLKFD